MNARKSNTIRKSVENLEQRDVPAQLANVQSIVMGDGSSQRSMVRQMTINFTEPVQVSESLVSAFTLSRSAVSNQDGVSEKVDLLTKWIGETTSTLTVTFDGKMTLDTGTLINGFYDLSIDATVVTVNADIRGLQVNEQGDHYSLPGSRENGMFRLAGDVNGDAKVNQIDYSALRQAYLGSSAAFDFDNDGVVSQNDMMTFFANYKAAL